MVLIFNSSWPSSLPLIRFTGAAEEPLREGVERAEERSCARGELEAAGEVKGASERLARQSKWRLEPF